MDASPEPVRVAPLLRDDKVRDRENQERRKLHVSKHARFHLRRRSHRGTRLAAQSGNFAKQIKKETFLKGHLNKVILLIPSKK